jgi:hypothetical protein
MDTLQRSGLIKTRSKGLTIFIPYGQLPMELDLPCRGFSSNYNMAFKRVVLRIIFMYGVHHPETSCLIYPQA